ncbi:hypothetical protein VOLCADRAFT_109204 [Volvox carteri f. nagariensis]|uniref:Steroid 5-alpha-reductase DET2 n=1 Tax=Volvox carteri f. nagariensis TaxID=3068 RepID=D8U4B7_VOLCA|nr:uncharacterized protein VOLCADRAFT_109204 [Volvox carteri f. nagariensis]EFJ45475.1 hypothetical protein VOLCADRAFT_109204 [Volvox carteri f. nagariensis]|eukprot:XP_002953502.1 hypothetical protein VOLCADRAFT_109204 [Volvox carteri f. nagariensis]
MFNVDLLLGKNGLDLALEEWHQIATWGMVVTAVPVFIALISGISAPYGRYSRSGWGFFLNARVAWLTQELPSPTIFVCMLLLFGAPGLLKHPFSSRTVLAAAFCAHYVYRAVAFPLLIRGGKPTPISVWAMSLIFCIWNGFVQGWSFARQMRDDVPIWTPRAVAGLALWLFGWINVMRADWILIHLRKPGETGYKIPVGGMFKYVSAGNYASEILEWIGFALAAGNLPACAFALFTFCNLAPRGHHHHHWYQEKFKGEYPKRRKAVVPFFW